MKTILAVAGGLALTACATDGGGEVAPVARPIPFPTQSSAGLAGVIGRDANQLTSLFGQPNADVREGQGRKLQFASAICVLDAYLYAHGRSEPTVTYVDARQTDGSPIDKASCVAALQKARR